MFPLFLPNVIFDSGVQCLLRHSNIPGLLSALLLVYCLQRQKGPAKLIAMLFSFIGILFLPNVIFDSGVRCLLRRRTQLTGNCRGTGWKTISIPTVGGLVRTSSRLGCLLVGEGETVMRRIWFPEMSLSSEEIPGIKR